MKNWNEIKQKINLKNWKLILLGTILIILIIVYFLICHKYIVKNRFAGEMEDIIQKNEVADFSLEKIYLCSSVNALDSNGEQKLENLDLYQYTDIAVYINNYDEEGLTSKNTIKQLYIDNVDIQLDNNNGQASLVYTNLLKIGSRDELRNILISNSDLTKDRIDFKIIDTNDQNNKSSYEEPTFYADCSNPITLKYINKLNKDYAMKQDETIMFDGSILKKAGVEIEDINARIRFKINIINNNGDYYSAWVNFKIPLNDIYQGTSIKSKNMVGREYDFFTL